VTLKPDESDRAAEYRIGNTAVLLSVLYLTLMTWGQLAGANHRLEWGPVAGVASTVVFGLAALTQCPRRAAFARLLTGMWMIAVPYLFGFSQISPVAWAYLAIGAVVGASSAKHVKFATWDVVQRLTWVAFIAAVPARQRVQAETGAGGLLPPGAHGVR
jgi:hypothetical protein